MLEQEAPILNLSGTIAPHLEIGAFEALWDNGISSFKQIREKLDSANAKLPSELIDTRLADQFFSRTVKKLKDSGVDSFGVRIDGTADYPKKLHDADYPLVLFYFQGEWDLAFTRGISVVGTRKPTQQGIERTKRLVSELVQNKFTIFSGLATGIDKIAHETTLAAGGRTVAVIGTPLSHSYPKENSELQKQIAKEHLLVSQVPVLRYEKNGPQFNRFYFPERNKTMSALSEATVIVEASETSGTLIQARAALKQGRKVFILNNNFENKKISWPKKFEALGAIRVHKVDDILGALGSGKQFTEN